MYFSVYAKVLAARIFVDICKHLQSLAQSIEKKLCATDSNISADKNRQHLHFCSYAIQAYCLLLQT